VVRRWNNSSADTLHGRAECLPIWGRAGGNSVFSSRFPMRYRFKRPSSGWGEDVTRQLDLPVSGLSPVRRGRTQIRYQSNQPPLNQARFFCSTLVQESVLLHNISWSFSFQKTTETGENKDTVVNDVLLVGLGCFAAEVPSGHMSVTHGCSSSFL